MTLRRIADEGCALAIATNQAGPAWRVETRDDKFPTPSSLAHRFQDIVDLIPVLDGAPWFVAIYDERLSLDDEAYQRLILEFERAKGSLDLHVSADPSWRKPRPGMLLAACRHYGVAPVEALYVGDAETDEAAAIAAGTDFVTEKDFFGAPGA